MSAAEDYAEAARDALEALQESGATVTLPRKTGDSIDPVTGAVVVGADATVTTTGIIIAYPDKLIDGTRILTGDRKLILSNEQKPVSTDKPTIGGKVWQIASIKEIAPDGATPIVYICQVRI